MMLGENPAPGKGDSVWPLHDAKAKFSQLIKDVEEDGVHRITKNGQEVAVIISIQKYEELAKPEKSLIEFFQAFPYPDIELEIERSKDKPRDIDL